MVSPLQKAPSGLLGAFDLKTLGRNPEAFGDTVVPIAEILDFYARLELFSVASAPGAIVLGSIADIVIPAGEAWLLRTVGAALTFTAADVCADGLGFSFGWAPSNSGDVSLFHSSAVRLPAGFTANAACAFEDAYALPRPLLLQPQTRIFVRTDAAVTGANAYIVLNGTFSRFLV